MKGNVQSYGCWPAQTQWGGPDVAMEQYGTYVVPTLFYGLALT